MGGMNTRGPEVAILKQMAREDIDRKKSKRNSKLKGTKQDWLCFLDSKQSHETKVARAGKEKGDGGVGGRGRGTRSYWVLEANTKIWLLFRNSQVLEGFEQIGDIIIMTFLRVWCSCWTREDTKKCMGEWKWGEVKCLLQ